MFGLIGKIVAVAGKRDELAAILLEGSGEMPGCLSYVVAHDASDADSIWVTEVWATQEHHRASLSLPAVKQAIERAKPLIASFGNFVQTLPIGGHGLRVT
jgi:quinol monooxygenase YgiN